ncbi:MAG: YfcE family phosphodiesterase [Patescibacteria group bacterium]|nr:YfcE family phosphodiesterase [Patescibacteria group bacterium]
MKFAIISDIHDNLANLSKTLNYCRKNKIEDIIFCGDLSNYETLKYLTNNFSGNFYLVDGNNDDYLWEKIKNSNFEIENQQIKIFQKIGEFSLGGFKIAITHFQWTAGDLARKDIYDLVFFGHTHKPSYEKIGKTELINPGNVANLLFSPSFAIYDTFKKKPKLILLNELK